MDNLGVNLIMPMAGRGSRFNGQGILQPKPLIEINGKPFFFWAAQSVLRHIDVASLTFVVLRDHVEQFRIDESIRKFYPSAQVIIIPQVLNGAVLTCQEGIKAINNEGPIIFNDCDHIFSSTAFINFLRQKSFLLTSGALLTFESMDPKFSYLQIGADGCVSRTVEKVVVSNLAICGAYFFKDRHTFKRCSDIYLNECSYQEFFLSGVYNVMAEMGEKITYFPTDMHVPFGTPEELKAVVGFKVFEPLAL